MTNPHDFNRDPHGAVRQTLGPPQSRHALRDQAAKAQRDAARAAGVPVPDEPAEAESGSPPAVYTPADVAPPIRQVWPRDGKNEAAPQGKKA